MKEEEEEIQILKNLELFKNKIKKKDIDNIDDWSSFSKETHSTGIVIKRNKIMSKILNLKLLIKISEKLKYNNLKIFKKNEFNEPNILKNVIEETFKNKIMVFSNIVFLYKRINFKKFNQIKKIEYYDLNKKNIYIVLDSRSLKTKIIAFLKNKCLTTLSNGLMFKKLKLNNKKYIKSEKVSYLTLKNFLSRLDFLKKYENIFIYIKGYKNKTNNFLKYINNKIMIKNIDKHKKIIIIHSLKKSNNSFFGFKKVKAIKRNLKKRIIKLNKNN